MPVTKVTIASPDFEGPDLPVTLVPGDGTITVTLPTLDAYDIVIVEY
jgi:hypothetical protein